MMGAKVRDFTALPSPFLEEVISKDVFWERMALPESPRVMKP